MDLKKILPTIRDAITFCTHIQSNLIRITKDKEVVTVADYGVQILLILAIKKYWPHDRVIAEEGSKQFNELVSVNQSSLLEKSLNELFGLSLTRSDIIEILDYGQEGKSDRAWVLDPVDGTEGFVENKNYAIALGVLENGQATNSVIAVPTYERREGKGWIFFTDEGRAFMTRAWAQAPLTQVHISNNVKLNNLRTIETGSKAYSERDRMKKIRQLIGIPEHNALLIDSQEKYTRLAVGEADIYLRLPRLDRPRPFMLWDHLPGIALVEAAGGRITDLYGNPINFAYTPEIDVDGLIVSNGHVHEYLIKFLEEFLNN